MTEWWTYRPSDFLLFSPRTYYRLFELYNAAVWPAPLLTLGLGLALWIALWQGRGWAPRTAWALLAAAWLWVAWGFHWHWFATINWAATWFAVAFAAEGALWGLLALRGGTRHAATMAPSRTRAVGLGLLLFALVVQPALGPAFGRPWSQVEIFGLAPDPTALGSLGVLLIVRTQRAWLLWPVPLLWCANAGMTLATMHAADAWLPLAAAAVALLAALFGRRDGDLR